MNVRKLPSRSKQAHLRHTRLPRRTLGLAALLGLAAAPVAAQAVTTTVPADFDLVAAPPVVAPGTLSADHQFTQAVAGFLNDDSIPDVAVIADGVVHVLLNPGFWSAHLALPGSDVRDLALVRRVSTQGDGLLTASASGATLWRWKASPTPVFTPYPVGGEWSDLSLVASEPSAWSTQLIVLLLLDAETNTLHSRIMVPDTDPALPPVLFEVFDPLPLPYPPMAIALFQLQPGGYPQVAVADATGLSLWSLDGPPLPLQSWPVSVTSSFLCPLERDASTGVARRLAWVRHAVGVSAQRVVVIDLQGNEPATNLGNAYTNSVATGSTTDSYGGPEYVEDEDLVLRRLDGTALVLQNECGLPEGQYGGATTFETDCLLAPSQTAPVPWDARGRPVIADFDVDGWDDLVTWDDAQGTALVGRRALAPAKPPELVLAGLEMLEWELLAGSPSVHLVLDSCALSTDTAAVEVIVWPSASETFAQIELDPVSIGYGFFDGGQAPDCGLGDWPISVPLALEGGERPPFIGIEVRALRASGRTSQVLTTLMTRECAAYDYLYCELEVLPYQPPNEECTGPPTCPTAPPTLGDYIAGLLPVARLPPFEGNQPPVIIVQ